LLRLEGAEALRARMRRDLEHARRFASLVEQAGGWAVVTPVKLQTVCVLHTPPGLGGEELDRHTLSWCEAINASGQAHLTPALVEGHWVVRVSIGAETTEWDDIGQLWTAMQAHAAAQDRA
jgi:aromatic-L-amino-acid decarboxylase